MSTTLWAITGIATLVVAAACIEAYVKRNRKRSLIDMRPDAAKLKRRPWEPDAVSRIYSDPVNPDHDAKHPAAENENPHPRTR